MNESVIKNEQDFSRVAEALEVGTGSGSGNQMDRLYIGSRLTMKYLSVILKGRKSRGEVISIALPGDGQHQDTGAKMIHAADATTSNVVSKSISVGKGRATYRGLVHIPQHLKGCKNNTECARGGRNANCLPTGHW